MTSCLWKSKTLFSTFVFTLIFVSLALTLTDAAQANPLPLSQEEVAAVADQAAVNSFTINNLWIMIAGMLVFIMHLGFATLESGLTRSKNTVNILFKNTAIVCIGLITYGVIGFHLMYPTFEDGASGYVKIADGWSGFLFNGAEQAVMPEEATAEQIASFNATSTSQYNAGYTLFTDFFFQAMFAATCCTIVSGAVAGRIKLGTFLLFCLFFVSISYPITGSWKWGEGWLDARGFYDLAGSTLVHSVGGWGALVMAFLLGPRAGKYVNGKRWQFSQAACRWRRSACSCCGLVGSVSMRDRFLRLTRAHVHLYCARPRWRRRLVDWLRQPFRPSMARSRISR